MKEICAKGRTSDGADDEHSPSLRGRCEEEARREEIFSHTLPIALKRGFTRVYDCNGTIPLKRRF